LGALVDHSLVQVSAVGAAGEPRYGLLETVREYGLEQLAAAGEATAVRERHLAWCLARAEEAAGAPQGAGQRALLEQLEAERDNLQAALAWSAREDPGRAGSGHEQLLRLGTALGPFWEVWGPLSEGRHWLEAALASAGAASVGLRLRALTAAGRLAAKQGDPEAAERWFGESLAGYRATGNRRGMATALTGLAQLVCWVRCGTDAGPLFEEALALWRELGDRAGTARALNGLAKVATEGGEYEVAATRLDESLALQRDLEDAPGIAEALLRLGECVLEQGDTARATQLFDEHLARARALGDPTTIASALLSRGEVAMRRGEFAEAEALMAESRALARRVDTRLWLSVALDRSGVLAAWQGHFELAAARVGEAWALLLAWLGKNADFGGALGKLAWIESCRGEHERAVTLAQENLAKLRAIGGQGNIAYGLMILGTTVQASGDATRARALFQESLALARHGRKAWWHKVTIVYDLAGLARMAAAHEQPGRAVVLYGASEACRATGPFPLAPPEEEVRDRVLVAARAALGEDAFARAWSTGQAMPLDEAIALALEEPAQSDR
jgi:tetratricopeptide (TPR) repeat protein